MNKIHLHYKFEDEHQDIAEIWIDGQVDGSSQRFILDTGCSRTSLYFSDFSAKYTSLGSRQYSSAFGPAMSDFIKVSQISSGPIQHSDIIIARTASGGNDKNLFGMDLLKNSILHFLPRQKKVEFLSNSSFITHSQNLYLDSGSIPIIELDINNKAAIAVWDTGAGITIVDQKFLIQNSDLFFSCGQTQGTDSAGHSFETEIYLMKSIKIGDYFFPEHRVVPIDLNHLNPHTGRRIDFILGYSTLRHANWLIDFPAKKWQISQTLF